MPHMGVYGPGIRNVAIYYEPTYIVIVFQYVGHSFDLPMIILIVTLTVKSNLVASSCSPFLCSRIYKFYKIKQ